MGNGRDDPDPHDLQQDVPGPTRFSTLHALDGHGVARALQHLSRSKQMEDVNAKFKELYDRPMHALSEASILKCCGLSGTCWSGSRVRQAVTTRTRHLAANCSVAMRHFATQILRECLRGRVS